MAIHRGDSDLKHKNGMLQQLCLNVPISPTTDAFRLRLGAPRPRGAPARTANTLVTTANHLCTARHGSTTAYAPIHGLRETEQHRSRTSGPLKDVPSPLGS